MRAILLKVHLVLGLTAGLIVFLAGLSGAVLAFQNEIDRALEPKLWHVTVDPRRPERLSLGVALSEAQHARAGDHPLGIRLPRAPDEPYEVLMVGRALVYIDPYLGKVLGTRMRDETFVGRFHDLHTRLFAGSWGRSLVGTASALLPVMISTGLFLWWPKKGRRREAFQIRRGSWKATIRDLHGLTGAIVAIVLFVIAGTGALMAFGAWTYPLIDQIVGSPARASTPPLAFEGPSVPIDTAVRIADLKLPNAPATYVALPDEKGGTFVVSKQYAEDHTPNGRSRVWVAVRGGTVMRVEDTRAAPTGTKVTNALRGIHTGDAFGMLGRVIAALVSLTASGMLLTGFAIWWGKRRKPEAAP